MINDRSMSPLITILKSGLHPARAFKSTSTAFQPSPFIEFHGAPEPRSQIANSLNRGEVIVWSVQRIHLALISERSVTLMANSKLSSAAFCPRSSGVSIIPNGYIAICT